MPETEPQSVEYHWIITVQTESGNIATYDGQIQVTPGVHTPQGTYAALRQGLIEKLGTDRLVVLFYSVQPNRF